MSDMTPWQRYLHRTTKKLENAEVARLTGVSASTVTRWFQRDTGSAEHVILLARTFGDDPKLALVETGHLSMEEATRENYSAHELLARFDELDLAREIVRRLEAGEAGDALADEVEPTEVPSNVSRLPQNLNPDTDEAHIGESWSVADSTPTFDPQKMAAKRGRKKADELPHAE